MEKTVVVMLGHKSLSGKDTVYGFARDLGFERAAFADKLKTTCMDLFSLSHDQVFGNSKDVMDERYPNTRDSEGIWIPQWELKDDQEVLGTNFNLKAALYKVKNPDYKPFLTPRRILQLFGQDQRSLFSDIWASYVFNTAVPELEAKGHRKIIVTDFRFENEAKVARQWGNKTGNRVLLYKVLRPGVVAQSGANDISETALDNFDDWDGTIRNDSDLTTLKARTVEELEDIINSEEPIVAVS